MAMKLGSLFSGYGGLDLAVEAVTGAETVWVSDIDKGALKILAHRYPDAPNIGDISKVDWSTVEPVDVITGGFPCQDVSHAGKRAGMHGHTRTGLWSYMRDAIDQLRPSLVVAENVRGLLSAEAASDVEPCPWCLGDGEGEPPLRALGAVLADLADIGYDAQWTGLRAADVGAPHGRFRIFVAAWPHEDAYRAVGGQRRVAAPGQAAGWGSRADAGGRDRAFAPDTDELGGLRWNRPKDEREVRADIGGDVDRCDPPPAVTHAGGERHGRGEDRRGVGRVDGEDESQPRERQRPRSIPSDRGGTATPDCPVCGHGELAHDGRTTCARCRSGYCTPADAEHDGRATATVGRGTGESETEGRLFEPEGSAADAWGLYAPAIHRWEAVLGRSAPAPLRPDGKHGAHRLNPAAVEFLMGLPAGWVMDVPDLTRNEQLKAFGNGVVPQQAAAALTHLLATQLVERTVA